MATDPDRIRAKAYLALLAGKTIRLTCRAEGTRSCGDGGYYRLDGVNTLLVLCPEIGCYEWDALPEPLLPRTMTAFHEVPIA